MNNITGIISGDINISKTERIISVAGGIALLVTGILSFKENKTAAWSEITTGAALLYRGTSGHCPVNAALNRNTAANELIIEIEEKFEELAG